MPYRFDIFISYRRQLEATRWIEQHFQPLLAHYVALELGREPLIFRDDQIEAGAAWPVTLGRCLADSRVLIALCTKLFFSSDWCTLELSAMLARNEARDRSALKLVVPIILHDCDVLPGRLADIQHVRISQCFNVRMQRDSYRAEQLADELSRLAPAIASAIVGAPRWRRVWPIDVGSNILREIRSNPAQRQTRVPGFGL